MTGPALAAAVLAERARWERNLEAERVTHSRETLPQLVARLEATERPRPARPRVSLAPLGDAAIRRLCDDVAELNPWSPDA
ncbi:hypothetical protein [Microcella alkaliphila]|uniref:Non-ribosomal peptide synthetase n=1 Tax=Microcella alkaliphila TaxID=279828 RepID=A0A0U5B9H8_9MICO|nr:hypothetical protein [Microcella alkaliphila]BAU32489.1 non-ribosomal peptide synthetase [Microcella alkaliphila]